MSQAFTGSLVGRVIVSCAAGMAAAPVALNTPEKQFNRYATSDIRGGYRFELVPPGRYTIRADHAGFAPSQTEVDVVVATVVRADLVLRIQQLREEVNVVG